MNINIDTTKKLLLTQLKKSISFVYLSPDDNLRPIHDIYQTTFNSTCSIRIFKKDTANDIPKQYFLNNFAENITTQLTKDTQKFINNNSIIVVFDLLISSSFSTSSTYLTSTTFWRPAEKSNKTPSLSTTRNLIL